MSTNKKRAIVLLSGGLDSYVSLIKSLKKYDVAFALTFDYGQEAFEDECQSSLKIAKKYNIEHKVIELPFLKEIKGTNIWIPNRNGLFINMAACYADSLKFDVIIFGANLEEAKEFKDNTAKYVKKTNSALRYSCNYPVRVVAPLIKLQKTHIIEYAIRKGLDLTLIKSCYIKSANGKKHCGTCPSCLKLQGALKKLKREDLLEKLGF